MASGNPSVDAKGLKSRKTWFPNFSHRKVGEGYFVSNRSGGWDYLNESEWHEVHALYCDEHLLQRLSKKFLVITKENSNDWFRQYEKWNSQTSLEPSLHVIHLTQRCNLVCSYCHSSAIGVEAQGRDLDDDSLLSICDFISLFSSDRITIAFQGGEPALEISKINSICEKIKSHPKNAKKKIQFGITTNGTILTEELVNVIESHDIKVTVSFDGPKDIHDKERKFPDGMGSFEDAKRNREELSSRLPKNVSGTIMVLTRESLSAIPSIINNYVDLGQSLIRLKAVTKLGRAKVNWNKNSITFEEYWNAYTEAFHIMRDYWKKGIFMMEHDLFFGLRKLLEGINVGDVDTRNPCGMIYGVLNYDINGSIYACHEGKRKKKFLIGNAKKDNPDIIYSRNSKLLSSNSVLDKYQECKSCAYQAYCTPCPAHNEQSFGSPEVKPYESWECKKTLRVFDLFVREYERTPDYFLDFWRYWQLKEGISSV